MSIEITKGNLCEFSHSHSAPMWRVEGSLVTRSPHTSAPAAAVGLWALSGCYDILTLD